MILHKFIKQNLRSLIYKNSLMVLNVYSNLMITQTIYNNINVIDFPRARLAPRFQERKAQF